MLIKVLSNFLLPILLDGKKGKNRGALSDKASSKAAFLILLLHNSSKDALFLFPLYPLMVSSNLCFFATKSGISIFGKDNAGKNTGDNPRSIDTDGRIEADNLGTRTDADAGANNPSTVVDNPSIAADNPGIAIDNLGMVVDDPGIETDADAGIDNLGTAADNTGTSTDIVAKADDSGIAASNKARVCAISLFALHRAVFLLTFSPELVIVSSPSSLPLYSQPLGGQNQYCHVQ